MQIPSNDIKRTSVIVRGAAVIVVALALGPWLWRVADSVGAASAAGVPVRSDEALTAVVASAALVGVAWLALSVLLELLCLVPGVLGRGAGRLADVVTPRVVRRATGALLGVGVLAGLAPGVAVAAPTKVAESAGVAPAAQPATTRTPLPDPGITPLPDPGWAPVAAEPPPTPRGWVPTRPSVRAHPDVRVLSPSPRSTRAAPPPEVVVRRGDTLWSIAARHLGQHASEAEIARAWPAWFDTNREVIGDDPDLLRPGQVLRPPPRSVS